MEQIPLDYNTGSRSVISVQSVLCREFSKKLEAAQFGYPTLGRAETRLMTDFTSNNAHTSKASSTYIETII